MNELPASQWSQSVVFAVIAVAALAGLLAINSFSPPPPHQPAVPKHPASPVVVHVDFGNGKRLEGEQASSPQMTVYDALAAVVGDDRAIASTGSGQFLAIDAIGSQRNEGSGEDSKNWLYWVNGSLADRGAGVYPVKAGDFIEWRFTTLPDELRSDWSE